MPTPTRGTVVRLFPDDRERFLRFSLLTLEDIQNEFGEDALTAKITGKRLAKVLWYGLKTDAERQGEKTEGEGATFTPDWIGDNVDMETIAPVIEALSYAFGARPMDAVPQTPSA